MTCFVVPSVEVPELAEVAARVFGSLDEIRVDEKGVQ